MTLEGFYSGMSRMDTLDKEGKPVYPTDAPPVPTPPAARYKENNYLETWENLQQQGE